ncbi:MAG: HAD hydrolase-like protein, partial [Desulfovibrionaceae bacterium]|nr:HAD hydrolase-like protein [Desulfovibrionaceae bacterium]
MKGIIFDCDGVLFDTLQANSIYYDILREQVGLPPLTKEEHEISYSATVQESLEMFTPPDKMNDILCAIQKTPYLETALPYITLDEELPKVLSLFENAEKKIGIFTNRTRNGVI